MEFDHTEPVAIWKQLIPKKHWLFYEDLPDDEMIFTYRNRVYFINFDGSVLSIPKPASLDLLDFGMLLDRLAISDEVIDFDDEGIFDYGSILKRMGYVVPTSQKHEKHTYSIELVNTIVPKTFTSRYELKQVSFLYALYHAVMRCHELNAKSDWEFEHEVKRIEQLETLYRSEVSNSV
ncbi:hypothetical protein ACQCN2_07145 [Brevibacillus ginsengisoli]|uniref:hypothetical protein n=1 Tax=Brevibacillus ginsengisoli TaxID=363854 RepID=UPI003CF6C5A3